MHTAHTAPEVYNALPVGKKDPFAWGYEYGKADQIKASYWAQRLHPGWLPPLAKQQEETAKEPAVQRSYENVWVPPGVDVDGTAKEGHFINVEVVR